MPSYSSIVLLGHLGHDPHPLLTEDGAKGARFSLAINRVWVDESGGRQQETDWYTVFVWGKLARACLAHLFKGRLVLVDGRPRIQQWEDEEGNMREQIQVLARRVIFLGSPAPENGNGRLSEVDENDVSPDDKASRLTNSQA